MTLSNPIDVKKDCANIKRSERQMFSKILIANRGEIACRVIKTARRMGILTVAVYSDADVDALHVTMADEAVYLGPSPSRDSYLVADKVIAAAKRTGAQAIHPGYGFLSENAEFCRLCADNDITFIGPPVEAIEAMGSKSAAKSIMEKAQVPLVPGYHGEAQDEAILKQAADDMGYPVLLKATAGGGGKGMRQVWQAGQFSEELAAAKREALNGFGDDTMLVEKYLTQPRHVEIQVFCDNHGNAVYLFERDCSVQRRHQKVIEEAPAPGMSETLRAEMGQAAIKAAQAIGYCGAGTVEFLLDVDGSFYFMEMNTRLQVEHPVTEYITKQDLVEWQLRVAANETLPKTQAQLSIYGHALEARIYAEDANNDFLPATGTLNFLQAPTESEHVRVDTGVLQGDEVSVYYDPMIAKLVVWDENRDKALQRLAKALSQYRISGVTTNIDFLYNLATCPAFVEADLDTGFIEKHHQQIFHNGPVQDNQVLTDNLAMAALYLVLAKANAANKKALLSNDSNSPWHQTNHWRANEANKQSLSLRPELGNSDDTFDIEIEHLNNRDGDAATQAYAISINNGAVIKCQGSLNDDQLLTTLNGYHSEASVHINKTSTDDVVTLYRQNGAFNFTQLTADLGDSDSQTANSAWGGLTAPMNGTVVSVLVEAGTEVEAEQALMIMEAMKMEHTIRAPHAGKVESVFYQTGDMVDGGAELLSFTVNEQE